MSDPFIYLTYWSILISYSIFIWTLIIGCPSWLFVFAATLLASTSIIGAFFIVLPTAETEAEQNGVAVQKVLLEGIGIHVGPFVLFLLLFNVLVSMISGVGRVGKFSKFVKIAIVFFIVIFAYLGYIKFEQVYFYDYMTLVILFAFTFVLNLQVFMSLTGV